MKNVVDMEKLTSIQRMKLRDRLLDDALPFGSSWNRWNILAGCYIEKGRKNREDKPRYLISSWCVCQCGTIEAVVNHDLTSGRSKSCGCYQKEVTSRLSTTHGLSKCPEYAVWAGMKGRCHNPDHVDYYSYGEKGVTVCQEWRDSFERFLTDMGRRPTDNHTIERVDVYGDYSPDNCIWLEKEEQAKNKRKEMRKKGTHPLYEYRKESRERKARGEYRVGGRTGGKPVEPVEE